MTEEEKKAIEKLKSYKELFSKGYCKDCNELCAIDNFPSKDLENNIDTLLNLIEKLQKENEELKEDNLGIREENIKLVNCHISYERYTGLDFLLPDKFKYAIPKDKIREIIIEELPDDDICKSCERYDVNGILIKQKLIKVLEE